MMGVEDAIRETVARYLDAFSSGERETWLDQFAADATVEDPIGSEKRVGRDAIGGLWDETRGLAERITLELTQGPAVRSHEAAFAFEARTELGDATVVIPIIDVMTFDDDGRIRSQRAFWSDQDLHTE